METSNIFSTSLTLSNKNLCGLGKLFFYRERMFYILCVLFYVFSQNILYLFSKVSKNVLCIFSTNLKVSKNVLCVLGNLWGRFSGPRRGREWMSAYSPANFPKLRHTYFGPLSPGCPGAALKTCEPQGLKSHRRDPKGSQRPPPQRTARAPGAPLGHAPQKA